MNNEELISYLNNIDFENSNIVYNEIEKLVRENQKLKKQVEETTKMIEKCGFANIEQVILNYCGLLSQQKEFIKYLEDEINKLKEQIKNYDIWHEAGTDINFLILKKQFYLEILQKYKSVIGDTNDKK